MKNPNELKNIVRDKYGEIARDGGSCCGPQSCCDSLGGVNFSEDYQGLDGYLPEADLGLGCGIPTEYAGIGPGQTVIDLGSGAGNDVFVVRAEVGEKGRVIGLDMVPDMVTRARANAGKLNYDNVEFVLGEIEDMPLDEGIADVVVSNCVLNLVPDKQRAFAEINRVLKPGGHFCVSDIVLEGTLPESLAQAAVAYAGCVSGALQTGEYLGAIRSAGLSEVAIRATRKIRLPEAMLAESLTDEEAASVRADGFGIYSVTVVGYKELEES